MKSKRRNGRRAAFAAGAGCWAAGLATALSARVIPGFADRYLERMNAFWVNTLGRLSSSVPWSVCELLLYITSALAAVWLIRLLSGLVRRREGVRRCLQSGLLFVILAGGIGFFLYECGEDVYFCTTPFAEKYGFGEGSYTTEELTAVCGTLVRRCNRYAGLVSREGEKTEAASAADPDQTGTSRSAADPVQTEKNRAAAKPALPGEPDPDAGQMLVSPDAEERARRAVSALGAAYPELRGYIVRPKGVLCSRLLSLARFSGIWTAVTGEAHYNRDMPQYNRPFSICHELAHSKGILRENEANLIAYLACSRSEDPDFRYSAALSGWIYCGNELYRRDRAAWKRLSETLAPSVRLDLEANTAFWRAYDGAAGRTAERLNHAYLKSKGIRSGAESYDQVVDLIISCEKENRMSLAD